MPDPKLSVKDMMKQLEDEKLALQNDKNELFLVEEEEDRHIAKNGAPSTPDVDYGSFTDGQLGDEFKKITKQLSEATARKAGADELQTIKDSMDKLAAEKTKRVAAAAPVAAPTIKKPVIDRPLEAVDDPIAQFEKSYAEYKEFSDDLDVRKERLVKLKEKLKELEAKKEEEDRKKAALPKEPWISEKAEGYLKKGVIALGAVTILTGGGAVYKKYKEVKKQDEIYAKKAQEKKHKKDDVAKTPVHVDTAGAKKDIAYPGTKIDTTKKSPDLVAAPVAIKHDPATHVTHAPKHKHHESVVLPDVTPDIAPDVTPVEKDSVGVASNDSLYESQIPNVIEVDSTVSPDTTVNTDTVVNADTVYEAPVATPVFADSTVSSDTVEFSPPKTDSIHAVNSTLNKDTVKFEKPSISSKISNFFIPKAEKIEKINPQDIHKDIHTPNFEDGSSSLKKHKVPEAPVFESEQKIKKEAKEIKTDTVEMVYPEEVSDEEVGPIKNTESKSKLETNYNLDAVGAGDIEDFPMSLVMDTASNNLYKNNHAYLKKLLEMGKLEGVAYSPEMTVGQYTDALRGVSYDESLDEEALKRSPYLHDITDSLNNTHEPVTKIEKIDPAGLHDIQIPGTKVGRVQKIKNIPDSTNIAKLDTSSTDHFITKVSDLPKVEIQEIKKTYNEEIKNLLKKHKVEKGDWHWIGGFFAKDIMNNPNYKFQRPAQPGFVKQSFYDLVRDIRTRIISSDFQKYRPMKPNETFESYAGSFIVFEDALKNIGEKNVAFFYKTHFGDNYNLKSDELDALNKMSAQAFMSNPEKFQYYYRNPEMYLKLQQDLLKQTKDNNIDRTVNGIPINDTMLGKHIKRIIDEITAKKLKP